MSESINQLEVLAARLTHDKQGTVRIHNLATRTTAALGDIEYVEVSYGGERNNLLLHYEWFTPKNCPYNQVPQVVPYIVIKNDVYELGSFNSIGYEDEELRAQ